MTYCKTTTIRYKRKAGTKTVYNEMDRRVDEYDKQQYLNCVNASPFFRAIGGTEVIKKGYTSRGYLVTRIISYSPNKEYKTVRLFDFDFND